MAHLPAVYVGPTLDAAVVRQLLPQAQVMPPIRRGDLYRDRLLGFETFLIVDGVFHQQLAISPREVVDVIQDGATVFGAASMGALRAAECWPAGMSGVGAIYRLYRRGHLRSDDDVAVAFSDAPPYTGVTVALINLRYAVSRARRRKMLTAVEAGQIMLAAQDRHFSARTWRSILRSVPDGVREELRDTLRGDDLKRLDACRAVRGLRTWIESRPDEGPSPGRTPRFLTRRPREALPAVPGGRQSQLTSADVLRWLLATGRYRRYASRWPGLDAIDEFDRDGANGCRGAADIAEIASCLATSKPALSRFGLSAAEIAGAIVADRTSPQILDALVADGRIAGCALMAQLVATGELDAVLLRMIAVADAVRWAGEHSVLPLDRHWALARAEIAANHGFRSWAEMHASLGMATAWSSIEEACGQFALAKRIRQELFTRAAFAPLTAGAPFKDQVTDGAAR